MPRTALRSSDEHFLPEPLGPVVMRVIGAGRLRGKRTAILHRRDRFFTLVLVTRGHGWFRSSTQPRLAVTAGQALMLFPGEEHSFAPDDDWDELWLMAIGSAFRALEADGIITRMRPVLTVGHDDELLRLMGQVVDDVRDHTGSLALHGARALHAWCLAAARDRAGTLPADTRSAVARVIAHLEADFAQPLIPDELVAASGLDWERLRKAFTAVCGTPPARWHRRRRITEAQRLLVAEPGLDLAGIARRTGFADAAHLSHRFQGEVGMSPGAWRRQRLGR